MDNSTEASSSIFGWQFQISASIYLMIKYFGRFEKMKLESKEEDIEITLENNKKIYAQAKSKQKPLDGNDGHSTKLNEALRTLSSKRKQDAEKLYYVNNLEPNPLNSGTNEFNDLTILDYYDLTQESKQKIDNQLHNLNISDFDKNKFSILKIPYYGNDKTQRQKYIDKQVAQFLISLNYSENFSKNLVEIWESEFLHNATIPNNEVYIKKDDVIWTMVVLKLKNEKSIDYNKDYGVDEEQFYMAVEKYEKIINYKEGNFSMVNKITYLHDNYIKQNTDKLIMDFINDNINELFEIIFDKSANIETDLIEITCTKIITRLILLRKQMFKNIVKGANSYGD